MEMLSSSLFDAWLDKLKDKHAQRRILHAIARCEAHGMMLGDIKPVGGKVSEMRFHFGSGYRVYYTQLGTVTVFLLAGGDKSSQSSDIQVAQELAKQLREEQP
ncbi:type II toxin-antitoxin system RelE/ParE family toxin [Actinotignum sp. GS-2025e]|uniref:type II toxin-antitoxin system RelE/ParE family toxin n=1 Tax=Actinotignum TaxID=1653174 RepID=UPI00047E0A06|nr:MULTISPECIES: type II toxin-antitoxin system RelE/ParE family toxin [Actinotignum]AIE82719.1 addiction module antitoxin RelB [Actinotignum schaalii]MDY5127510.1 type II toxin-antitoxin system RelE/ParE family toxin [Actinotignum sp. SLA_B059]MDY5138236.1 type II toxin-antitoxin system RelE/ParE family toxin [Actinotignum timonense]WQN44819.1 type II toxin-antitoxin system RelE/ParE family toxin [Actinotignum schaalii]